MNKKRLTITLLLSIGLYITSAQASIYEQTGCNRSNVYEDIECLDKENAQFVNDINTIYKIIKTKPFAVDEAIVPSSAYVKHFTESQSAWNQFTTANCQMLNLPYAGLQGGGIGLVQKSCWNKAYRSRVNELNRWLTELQE